MRIGFITHGESEDLELAKRHKIETIELLSGRSDTGSTDLDSLYENLPAVESAVKNGDVAVSAMTITVNLFLDDAVGDQNRQDMRDLLEWCPRIGSRVLAVSAGDRADMSLDEKLSRFHKEFSPIMDRASALNVRLAVIKCSGQNFAHTPEIWRQLADRYPADVFGLKYDPSHIFGRSDYLDEIDEFGPRLIHFHAKDVMASSTKGLGQPPPGLGQIPWGPIFALLYKHDYQGDVCYEPHHEPWLRGPRRPDGIILAVRHLRQFVV